MESSSSEQMRGAQPNHAARHFAARLLSVFASQPDRVAVRDSQRTYSYAELYDRASSVAAALGALSLAPGSVVGIHMQRAFDYVGCVLGTLFSGHSFVPVDARYPHARVLNILEDAGVSCVLHSLVSDDSGLGVPTIDVRTLAKDGSAGALEALPLDIVYTIYTSGTTGRPKGVPIAGRDLAHFLDCQGEYLAVTPASRFAAVASISFDMSIWELFLPLWHGASVSLFDQNVCVDGRALARSLEADEVTHVLMTPSMLGVLAPLRFPAMQHVVSAGEKCNKNLVAFWSERCRFYDAYGATEATIYTTITPKTPDTPINDVGTPMHGTAIVIVDEEMNQLPAGESGEICIIGGVSAGYLNRPELNRQKFVSHRGRRVYRTGDLGCLTDAGRLLFRGRKDKQIKWNGYRIELEEIEAIANKTGLIKASHATLSEERVTTPALLLFVTPDQAAGYSAPIFRSKLREQLPSYMMPSRVVEVGSMPMTTTGKINSDMLVAFAGKGSST